MLGAKLIKAAASQTASAAALKRIMEGNFAVVFTLGGSLAIGMLFLMSIAGTVAAAAAWRYDTTSVCLFFGSSVGFFIVYFPGCFPGTLVCGHALGLMIAEGSIALM